MLAEDEDGDQWPWRNTKHLSEKRPLHNYKRAKTQNTCALSFSCAHNHAQPRSRSLQNTHEQQAPVGHTQTRAHTHTGARSHWLRGGDRPMTTIKRRDKTRRAHWKLPRAHGKRCGFCRVASVEVQTLPNVFSSCVITYSFCRGRLRAREPNPQSNLIQISRDFWLY